MNERTDNGFESQIFSRVLISISSDRFPLLHPFPVISLTSHLVMVDDVVALRVGDFDVGVIGKIITLNGGLFQNRCLLESEFLLNVYFIKREIKDFPLSVPQPNELDFAYGNIPLNCTYIFRHIDISYVFVENLSIPDWPSYFLQRNGFKK